MKISLMIITLVLLSILGYFIYLAIKSHTGQAPGLVNQQLSPCPDTPNCLCSEYPDDRGHYIEAIKVEAFSPELIHKIEAAILEAGAKVIHKQADYIAAEYTTSLFRYVDDFEVRVSSEDRLIHIRSASRVGRSDFGANRKRIEQFTGLLNDQLRK